MGVEKLETGKTAKNRSICGLNTDSKLNINHKDIAGTFNKQFISVAENLKKKTNNSSINNSDNTTPIHYFYNLLRVPFQTLNLSYYQLGKLRI